MRNFEEFDGRYGGKFGSRWISSVGLSALAFALTIILLGAGTARGDDGRYSDAVERSSSLVPHSEEAVGKNTTATLRVSGSYSFEGTIVSSPSGINCGYTCSATFNRGSSVTLTAEARPGYIFDRWSGCTSSSGNQCSVALSTYSSSKTVYAYFDEYPTLTVSKSPSFGGGDVTGSGLDCGARCSIDVAPNSQVVLTATPKSGYYFDRWSGCSSSSGATCTVSMTSSDKRVTAYFKRNPTLRVSKSLSSGGDVTGPNLDCGFRCSIDVAPNSQVVLTATPKSGYYFDRWSGCSRSSGATCTVSMTSSDKRVTAYFKRIRKS